MAAGNLSIAQRNGLQMSLIHTVPEQHLPPPYDRHPDFPVIVFDADGQPHTLDAPPNMVFQLVPAWDNKYAWRYREHARYRSWYEPESVHAQVLAEWEAGADVTFHASIPNVRVVGVSRGMPRFVQGKDFSVFVVDELGMLPPGSAIGEVFTDGMIVTRGVKVPYRDNPVPQFHVFPSEFLADPSLPGLPVGLTLMDRNYWLAPPPVFFRGYPMPENPGYAYARINHYVSQREHDEGGGSNGEFVIRGGTYRTLHGSFISI